MTLYSISQLSQFSGIKPHTIRMWEQRYSALKPLRSEGNTRYYDSYQLRRLLNIVSLMGSGHKVSDLCRMSDEKMFSLIKGNLDNLQEDEPQEYFISQFIAAGMDYDEAHFEKTFSHCLLRYGMTEMYRQVIYPTILRIGVLWTGNMIPPAQEHFISNLFRQKLCMAIDSLPVVSSDADGWILFLPENEYHELGLLFSNYLVRLAGKRAIYLGANVPLSSVSGAVEDTGVSNLLLFLVHYDLPEVVTGYLEALKNEFRNKHIYIAGNKKLLSELEKTKNMTLLNTVEEFGERLGLSNTSEVWQK